MTANLSLPPLYRAVVLDGDPAEDTRSRAARLAGEGAEAGTFVWRPGAERLDCAVLLRPEEPAESVVPAVLVATLALSDALGAVGPPGLMLDLVWPGGVRVNGGLAGGIMLDLAPGDDAKDVPEWAVLAVDMRIAPDPGIEGGERVDETCLQAEGFAAGDARPLAEAFARYLLVWMDRWQDQGLPPIARQWLPRATARGPDTVLLLGPELVAGAIEGLDEAGGLKLDTAAGPRTLSLMDWARAGRG